MKQLIMEPTHKKSLLEYQVWTKEIDGHKVRATMELGWRWGSFYINIPDTDEEIIEWANNAFGQTDYYKTIEEVLNDYGCESVEEMQSTDRFLPSIDEEHIELDEYDTEMIETWDGCWEDWSVYVPSDSELDSDVIKEEVEEGWYEDSWSYMEENGWLEEDCYFEMCCNPKFYEVDENGDAIIPDEEVNT